MLSKKQQKKVKPSNKSLQSKGKRKVRKTFSGLAPYATNPMRPSKISNRTRRSDGSSCRIKGTDFLTPITISATAATAGDVLISTVVNPASLNVARLNTMSRLYERYKFRSLKFRYVPVANATITGQLIGYVDYDTYDDPTGLSGVQNLQRAAAHYGEKPVQIWQGSEKPVFWELKDVDPLSDLYIDSDGTDPRWTNQGRFIVLASSAIAANTPCGNVYIDYDIEFYVPQIELTPSGGTSYNLIGAGGSFSASAYFGAAPTPKSWNNLPVTRSANIFTLPPGCYQASGWITGTTLAPTVATSGTTLDTYLDTNAATTRSTWMISFYSTSIVTLTFAGTAASVTGSGIYISLMPKDAVTLTTRTIARFESALRKLDFLRKSIPTDNQDSKESKVTVDEGVKHPLIRTCSSSSSSSSTDSVARVYEDQFVLVRKS